MSDTHNRRGETQQSRYTWIVPLVLIAALVGAYFVWPAYQGFVDKAYDLLTSGEQDRFEQWIRGYGAWGPLVLGGLMIMQTLLAFIPSVLIMVVSVLAYGAVLGGVLAWAGLLLAASVGYGIGRALGPVTIYRLIGSETEEKVEHFVERYGLWAIVAARISPALSTDAVSLVAGLVRMGYPRFLLATGAGTLPLTILIAYLGEDIQRLETGLLWVSVVSLAIFIGYVIYDRRFREK